VRQLWLVDPIARTLEVYGLENGRWTVAGTTAATNRSGPSPSRRSRST
jgi:hypothetical protein